MPAPMFKFLRKYNKYILAVGGTLLLITFLIPFAFTNLLQGVGSGRAAWASVGVEKTQKITATDLAMVQRELRLLQYIGPQLQMPGLDRPEYWYLLVREAAEAGLIPAPASIGRTEQDIQQIGLLASLTGESVSLIRATLANVEGVERLLAIGPVTSSSMARRSPGAGSSTTSRRPSPSWTASPTWTQPSRRASKRASRARATGHFPSGA